MKKLLSIVLTIAMLASMLSVPVVVGAQSYPTIDLSSGFVADTSFGNSNFTEAAVYGIAGKDASDESVKLTENSNQWTSWYQYNHGEELYFENGQHMEGYLVVELNFMAPDAAYLSEFIFGISSNQQRMTVNPTAKLKENIGKWNHLRMVYWADETNCDFTDFSNDIPNIANAKLGSTELFLNGESLGTKNLTAGTNESSSTGTIYTSPINTLLLEVYSGDRSAQHYTYYDDIKIYKADTNPGAQSNAAIAATSEYTVSGTTITLASGASLTPADIAAANSGYTITAFEDATLSTQLASGANLTLENVVVAKSPDGVYTYYDVVDAATNILYSEKDGNFANTKKLTQTSVKGIAGKSLDDESAMFVGTSENDGNIMISKDGFYTKSKKYLVIEANINPIDGENDITSVSVHTTGHGGVSGHVKIESLPFGQWNKYLMYVDFTGDSPVAQTFVNGQQVITNNAANANIAAANATIRLCFNGTKETDIAVYVDDMKWYETDNLPDGAAKTALPAPASSEYYSVADGKVKALPTTTVANIKAANAALTTRVYTDDTMIEYAADTAVVETGMVVVVENGYKALAAYPLVVSYGETELDLRTGDASHAFPSVANGTGTTVDGFAGKDASDKVLASTPTGDTFISLNSWGTVVKTGSDNSVTPSWSKTDYNGYLVVEASVYNVDNTSIALVTTQTGQVSGNVADYIPKNQWARVKFVYNAVDGDDNEGKTMTYVDGKAVTGWVNSVFGKLATYNTNNYMRNDVRISIKGSTSGNVATYLDDIRMYEIPVLRPEQTIDFVAPGACSATDSEFGYVEGTTVTVGEVKNANQNIAVKVFNSKTDYTEITDTTAALSVGNVIFVNKQSQSAIDAGIDYKDLFRVMTVAETPATKDIVSAPAGGTRYTLSDVTDGMFGNTSATIKKVTDTNSSNSNWYFGHSHNGLSDGMNYLVYEMDFAPTADTSYLFFGADGHGALSSHINVGSELTANQWHKIVMVYDVANDLSDVYVNGKLVSDDYTGCYNAKYKEKNGTVNLRLIVECKMSSVSYIDNYKIYESVFYPEIAAPATLTAGYNAAVGGFVDNTSMVASVKNGTAADITVSGSEVSVLDSSYNAVTDVIESGDIIFVKKNGNFAYYNVTSLANNDIVILGDTYDANTGVMTPGSINAYGVTTDGGVVVVAQFDEAGNMIKAKSSATADANGIVTVAFDADDIDDTVVKAFLMNSFEKLTPLCENKEIAHTRSYNLLMLGNSFSMDVTCYMEEIAAAADKKFNIAVLNKGGSAVAYHYTNREMPLDSSDIYFWLNDQGQGYSNLKTVLENYDWDYVVIQNWGSSTSFYENTDTNYAANWAVITDLAKYIHEREPEAELMLHETWSFEAGYNTWTDAATRDAAGANIRAVYDRCAAEIKSELGLDYDVRKISSLDAFEAAREYVNTDGVQMFETTYYKDGHLFSGYDNRATVPVGDGTQLLSPEDAAEGKVSLHRDGFHASAAARYLIALNAVQFLTGKSVYGNTYRPGEIALDSSAYYGGNEVTDLDNASSGVIYQKYDPLSETIVAAMQTIVEGIR